MDTFYSEDSPRGTLVIQKSYDRFLCPRQPIVDLCHLRPIVGDRDYLPDDEESGGPDNLESRSEPRHASQRSHHRHHQAGGGPAQARLCPPVLA